MSSCTYYLKHVLARNVILHILFQAIYSLHSEMSILMKTESIVGTWMTKAFVVNDSSSSVLGPSKDYGGRIPTE